MHLLYKIQHIRALYYSFIQNKIIHAKKLYVFKYVNALKINEFYYFFIFLFKYFIALRGILMYNTNILQITHFYFYYL